ncbi:MAG: hypothetical protein P4L46_13285 [Fimbriimonas sp.]|nr:hypothetical protein [Fimbriimonas sp.]
MKRLNFTVDDETATLLESLAAQLYGGNKSLAIRSAVESLAAHSGHSGWVISGFTPVELSRDTACHCCHTTFAVGQTLFKPVFERGVAQNALQELPVEPWLDCQRCALGHV